MLSTMRAATGLLAALLLGACSCAGSSDAMQKELSDIRSELVRLRAQTAILTDRLDSMETAARRVSAAPRAPVQEDPDRPALEVVHLAPEPRASAPPQASAEAPADRPSPRQAQDGGRAETQAGPPAGDSRPVIRLTGKAGADSRTPVKKSPSYAKP
jgi:hypothetical protein